MGVKEVRVTRGRIVALYRAKEKHDVERERNRKNILGIIQRLRSQAVNVDVVERDHYIILSEGGIRMVRWIVKKLFSKNAHPALFLRNKKVSLNETKRIGFVKIVPKLSVNRVLKEMTIPFTSYSINNKVGELLIQVLLNDHY